ncbi:hypothetical protein JB92DRAFT_3190661 [Gautieria morchelliformis]|nr:hypothetical protein JB92DRAFT_3190661 [Gautieria morchelliformis]
MDEKETDEERKERLKGAESATTSQLLPNVLTIRPTKQERSTKHMLPGELLDQVVNHSTCPMSSSLKTLRVESIALAEQDPKNYAFTQSPSTKSETLQAIVHQLTDQEMYKTSDNLLSIASKIMELEESLPHLVSDLYAEGDLSKLQAWDIYESKAKDRDRIKERAQRQGKDEDDGVTKTQQDTAGEASFDPSDPSPEFSFAGIKSSANKTSLESDLRGLSWTRTPDWAIVAIRRGIAVHHSGMNRKYRNLVETLFRVGFLQVVIATGTLALGINAPCKTVVFSGDSTFLTYNIGKLQLGKVVFHSITLDRVQRLYLLRAQILSSDGQPLNLAGIVTHVLFWQL